MDEVIGMSEIDGGIDMGFTRSGKEVGNEQKGILVFFGYFIETLEIYAEVEGFIFLKGEDYQSTMGGGSCRELRAQIEREDTLERSAEKFLLPN